MIVSAEQGPGGIKKMSPAFISVTGPPPWQRLPVRKQPARCAPLRSSSCRGWANVHGRLPSWRIGGAVNGHAADVDQFKLPFSKVRTSSGFSNRFRMTSSMVFSSSFYFRVRMPHRHCPHVERCSRYSTTRFIIHRPLANCRLLIVWIQ